MNRGLLLALGAFFHTGAVGGVFPLAVPKTGHPGFANVAGSSSGVNFTNSLAPLAAGRNPNLMNGSGVAAGDFDGDGLCDLYFCAISGTNALFRNLGGWRFQEVAANAGVSCPQWVSTGAVFADIDGDGDLDLLVSTLGSGVHCFRNDGRGQFSEITAEAGLTSSSGSMSLALADVDGDGDLDLYVANYGAFSVLRFGGRTEIKQLNGQWVVTGPNAHRLRFVDGHMEEVGEVGVLYLNDGTGRFQAAPWNSARFLDETGRPKPPPPDYGLSVQMRDINGDGAPDIYVCNDLQTPDRLWLNDGSGNFREASRLAIRKFPFSSMGVDFADLDRNGEIDFLAVEMLGRDHARRIRQVSGVTFLPNIPGRFGLRPEVNRNTLYRGNGDGTWSEIAEFAGVAATDWSWQPVFLDVDLDGYEDLLVVNGMMFDTQDRDSLAYIRSLGKQSAEATRTHLLLYPPFPSPKSAFRNRGDLTFEDRSKAWGFEAVGISQGIALADLDGDGDLDVAINNLNSGASVYRNESAAPRVTLRLKGRAPNTRGIGGRIRVLGGPVIQSQEIIAGGRYLSGDDTLRTFAAGAAKQLTVEVSWRSGQQTVISNAEPNHLYEMAETDARPVAPKSVGRPRPLFTDETARLHHTHHEPLFDDYARQPLLAKQLSSLGPGVAWCDLDADGRDELVIGTGRGGHVGGFRFSPGGEILPLGSDWTAPDDVTGFTAWITADGKPALLAAVANYETSLANSPVVVLISASAGTTHLTVTPFDEIPPANASNGTLAPADYDGDGDLDLFVGGRVLPGAYPQAASSRLFRRDGSRLVPDTAANLLLDQVGLVSGAVWSDLDGDGFPELILACEWGPLRIFRNNHGKLAAWDPLITKAAARSGARPSDVRDKLSMLTGWWISVTAGDIDGDGRLDLIAGNWGLNTGYQADAARPLRLYHGNLGGAGTTDLIEAYYPAELTSEVSRRSLNALSQALPMLAERFPTHAAFSVATMPDVLAALSVKPGVVSVSTLATMLFLNRGDSFIAIPLPAAAQLAPVFGLVVADADGDGQEDLFLAQNFFAMRSEWSRTDAGRGLWLRGDRSGDLMPMAGIGSGVRIYGEQRGAAVGDFDLDGRPDLVVAQNGAPTTLWHNDLATVGLRVRLAGPPGNPCGYGAVAQLKFGDRLGPAREFHAGAGYWSQDSSVQILAMPAAPTRIQVRWPGGASSVHPMPRGVGEVIVHHSGKLEVR
ncbi:MAG: hypothetical protein EXS36_06415 [Pedosphaera sp.]|nr:hypothetical protein [Pedosphaera sp.]